MGLVSGTSSALVCGLVSARNQLLRNQGWDVGKHGLMASPGIRVILSDRAHGTVLKALSLIGLGTDQVIRIPCDSQGRMKVALLPDLDDSTLIVASAGEVNSGSFDDLATICERARETGAWVHVDGAFGLWAAASSATYPLIKGFEYADSWSVDAHKTLNAPYDCGIILCRHRSTLVSALQASGSYLQWSENRDGMLYTMDMSRRGRAVELWAVLRTLGKAGVESLVDQLCSRASLFATLLSSNGFEILNEVVFNQVLVAFGTNEQTNDILSLIQCGGECWCSGSVWNGRSVIRVSVCSYVTTIEDVERSVEAFILARRKMRLSSDSHS